MPYFTSTELDNQTVRAEFINENTKIDKKNKKSTTACFAKDGSSGGILFKFYMNKIPFDEPSLAKQAVVDFKFFIYFSIFINIYINNAILYETLALHI